MDSYDFKIKFDGKQHQIEAATLIGSLATTLTILQEINEAVDPSHRLEIKVKAPEKGSLVLVLELVKETIDKIAPLITRDNIEATGWIVAGFVGLFEIRKHLKGEKPSEIKSSDSVVSITNGSGNTIVINKQVYHIYENNQSIRIALSKNFETLSEDDSISGYTITDSDDKPLVKIEQEEFESLGNANSDLKEDERNTLANNAVLNIIRVAFDRKLTWEFYYKGNKIKAKIDDPSFHERIDKGESFSKGDTLIVDLEIKQINDESVGTYINKGYIIKKIIHHVSRRENDGQVGLFG